MKLWIPHMSPCSERDIVRKIVLYLALVAILVGGGGGNNGHRFR